MKKYFVLFLFILMPLSIFAEGQGMAQIFFYFFIIPCLFYCICICSVAWVITPIRYRPLTMALCLSPLYPELERGEYWPISIYILFGAMEIKDLIISFFTSLTICFVSLYLIIKLINILKQVYNKICNNK